jgi:hypothetical protein
MADEHTNNYVIGRGRLFFGQFAPNTRRSRGELYFGNTPELSLSQDEDTLDHYSSEGGVRVKDDSVVLQTDSSGSFQCDNINGPNLALWFRGEVTSRTEAGSDAASGTITFSTAVPAAGDTVTVNGNEIEFIAADGDPVGMQVAVGATIAETATALADFIRVNSAALGVTASANAAVTTVTALLPGADGNSITLAKVAATPANITVSGATLAGGEDVEETLTNVQKGRWYQLGVSAGNPQGINNIGSVSITGIDPEDEDANFKVEAATGRIYIHSDAPGINEGDDLELAYGVTASVQEVVIAKGDSIEGELRFIANNAKGKNRDYYWPFVRLTPDGDFDLKGDDWQAITFNFEILKRDEVTERQYITKRD